MAPISQDFPKFWNLRNGPALELGFGNGLRKCDVRWTGTGTVFLPKSDSLSDDTTQPRLDGVLQVKKRSANPAEWTVEPPLA